MEYFTNCTNLDDLKREYRKLAFQHHPDRGGKTKENKEALKAAGCRWSQNKGLWYWHHEQPGKKWRRGKTTMNEIRAKYGSYVITGSGEHHSRGNCPVAV